MTVNSKDYIDEDYGLFINGEFVNSDSGETLEVVNPVTGDTLSSIEKANYADIDKAVAAAQEAFESWHLTSKTERANLLRKISDKIMENKDKIATIETLNNGKPI